MSLLWEEHPIWPVPSQEQALAMGPAKLAWYYNTRAEKIRLAKVDPYRYGCVLPHWLRAEEELAKCVLLCLFGGNGSAKTMFAIWKAMKLVVEVPGSKVLFLHNVRNPAGVQVHDRWVHYWLPAEWKKLGKKGQITNVTWSAKNGFADGVASFPNESFMAFGSYKDDLEKWEGTMWNLVVGDENFPLAWLTTLMFRVSRVGGKIIWPFTPVKGITPAMAWVVDAARTIESQPVDPDILPTDQVLVKGLPKGHLPRLQTSSTVEDCRIMYFRWDENPFTDLGAQKRLLMAKDRTEKLRRGYGYDRNVVGRKFPLFGESGVHVVDPSKVPEDATRYLIMDPAGARSFFLTWVAVDRWKRAFIYREWPDIETHGEWAVLSMEKGVWDGDQGPAQLMKISSVLEYKKLILTLQGSVWDKEKGLWVGGEEIEEIIVDPRGGKAESVAEEDGGTSLIDRFEEEQEVNGMIEGPSMTLIPAPAQLIEDGVREINNLLAWNSELDLVPLINEPRLFVSRRCGNTIWSLSKWTGLDGEKGACKDPCDNVRYFAVSDLEYEDPKRVSGASAGGSY